MRLIEYLQAAVIDLLRHKMRTGLTMLGIIVGVAAVITMVALGTGAQRAVDEQIAHQDDRIDRLEVETTPSADSAAAEGDAASGRWIFLVLAILLGLALIAQFVRG